MKTTGVISTVAFILVTVFSCYFSGLYAQTSQNERTAETEQRTAKTSQKTKKSRPRTSFVKTAGFYLRNGKLIFGKLVSEDKNKITVEQLDEDRIVVSTYSKREVDTRTMHIRKVLEYKYYIELAEYFSSRTWDFKNDADDFIQAIRWYEKARQSVGENQTRGSLKIEQINISLKQLQADRQVWIRETASRAELKKLEFEAEIETRFKELEDKINANSQQVNKSMEQLDKIIADMKDNRQKLEKSISEINKNMSRQLGILRDRIESNRELIAYTWRWYPRRYYPYNKPGNNQ